MLAIAQRGHADNELECRRRLIDAEPLFNQRLDAKLLSEQDVEEIALLLDKTDEACTLGDGKGLNEALDELMPSAQQKGQTDAPR